MGVNNAFEMAMAAPAIGMAQQAGARPVFDREGTMLPDEAAGLAALNTAGFFIPGMVNERFGQRVEEGSRQQPGAALAGDVAGGMIGGELIGLGLQKAWQAIAPCVSAIGRLFKGKPAAAPAAAAEPPMVLGPQNRILPVDRTDALPGDDVEMARALDAWTPPVEQKVMPMGFGSGRGYTDRLNATTTIAEAADVIARTRFKPAKRLDRAATAEDWTDATEEAADILRVEAQRQGGNDAAAQVAREFSPDSIADPKGKPRLVFEDLAAQILRSKGIDPEPIYGPMKADRLTNAERGVNAKLFTQAKGEAIVNDQMIDEFGPDIAAAERAKPPRLNGLLAERGRDAVEQTFGAAYMSGTGSVAGGQYDLNGDGEIDNTDLAIGSGIGLAAFASPLALRKVAELGGRLKGTKAPAGGDDINAAGFGLQAPRRTEAFMDDRLTPSENKALEMRRNGFSTEEIAEEMDTSTNTVLKFISTAKSKGVEVEPIKRGPPMNRTPDVLRLAEQGLRPNIIAERLGLTRNNVSVLLTKERARLKKAGKPIPKWMSPRDPGGNIKEVN